MVGGAIVGVWRRDIEAHQSLESWEKEFSQVKEA